MSTGSIHALASCHTQHAGKTQLQIVQEVQVKSQGVNTVDFAMQMQPNCMQLPNGW